MSSVRLSRLNSDLAEIYDDGLQDRFSEDSSFNILIYHGSIALVVQLIVKLETERVSCFIFLGDCEVGIDEEGKIDSTVSVSKLTEIIELTYLDSQMSLCLAQNLAGICNLFFISRVTEVLL